LGSSQTAELDDVEEQMPVAGLFRNAQQTLKIAAGEVVFTEGDSAAQMFGIIEGQIELQAGDRSIAPLGPGEVFDEMALVHDSPRMATALAKTESVLAVIDRRFFLFLIHETPTFALDVMSTLAARLRAQSHAG
jgi:CRP/FNR family transcriptional regulator, cyclic AMP receptor protein